MGVWVRYHITTHEMCRTKRRGKRAAQARAPAATRAVTRVPAPQTQVASVTQRRSQRRPRKTQRIPSRSQAVEVRERLMRKRKAGRWIFNLKISSRCQPWSVSGSSEWIPLPSQESFRLAGSQEKVSIAQETLAQVPCHEEAKNNHVYRVKAKHFQKPTTHLPARKRVPSPLIAKEELGLSLGSGGGAGVEAGRGVQRLKWELFLPFLVFILLFFSQEIYFFLSPSSLPRSTLDDWRGTWTKITYRS